LTIKYDGTDYCGWQVQRNAKTVQETLQNALHSIINENCYVVGCSRTDSGVHANMFCLHFDSNSAIENDKLVLALNARLPQDISAINCDFVADDFHARYSCKGKNYIYKIHNSPIRDAFLYKYSLQVNKELDIDLLNKAAAVFLGTHDFSGFCSVGSSVQNTVRTVTECGFKREANLLIFSISADGFLYNMVRIIVGTLLEVAYGNISVDDLPKIIISCNRDLAGPTAKPQGLFLNKVFY
jgi:tRNA pseudouridine38-40 synthase